MSWIETLWGLTYDGKVVTWERFTKRTDDPKLGWLERRLAEADIPFRRNGSSAHAPILEVDEDRLDDAWAILSPVDDVEDDDPQFLELEMPKKPDKKVKKARKPKQQHPKVSDAAMANLIVLLREAAGVVNDPNTQVTVYLWPEEPRVAEVTFSGPTDGGGWSGSSFMQSELSHAPLLFACERYLWHYDHMQEDIELVELDIHTFFADDDETPVQRYSTTYVELLHRMHELKRAGYNTERLDKATEELRQILVELEGEKPGLQEKVADDSKRDFFYTVVSVEVLSEEPIGEPDLTQVHRGITDGEWSGVVSTHRSRKVSGPVMAKLLEAQGSDPGFFRLTSEGEDAE